MTDREREARERLWAAWQDASFKEENLYVKAGDLRTVLAALEALRADVEAAEQRMTTDRDREAAEALLAAINADENRNDAPVACSLMHLGGAIAKARREGCQQGIEAAAKVVELLTPARAGDAAWWRGYTQAVADCLSRMSTLDPDTVLGDADAS